jgi:hypothetical protein
MSLHHYPQLLQSLPGKVQDDIERQPEDVALDKEIEALRETLKGLSTGHETKQDRARWEELYWQKRQLASAELNRNPLEMRARVSMLFSKPHEIARLC